MENVQTEQTVSLIGAEEEIPPSLPPFPPRSNDSEDVMSLFGLALYLQADGPGEKTQVSQRKLFEK